MTGWAWVWAVLFGVSATTTLAAVVVLAVRFVTRSLARRPATAAESADSETVEFGLFAVHRRCLQELRDKGTVVSEDGWCRRVLWGTDLRGSDRPLTPPRELRPTAARRNLIDSTRGLDQASRWRVCDTAEHSAEAATDVLDRILDGLQQQMEQRDEVDGREP